MAAKEQVFPVTMISPETGEILTRGSRPFVVDYKGESVTVDLPGYYPEGEGDGVHVGKDMSSGRRGASRLEGEGRRRPLAGDDPARAREAAFIAARSGRIVQGR